MSDTVFKQVNYDLNSLIKYIELGEIGLPDIQTTELSASQTQEYIKQRYKV